MIYLILLVNLQLLMVLVGNVSLDWIGDVVGSFIGESIGDSKGEIVGYRAEKKLHSTLFRGTHE